MSKSNVKFQYLLFLLESTVRCSSTIQNGAFANPCSFRVKTSCPYVCDTGFDKNPLVDRVMCMDTGSWNFNLLSLCKPGKNYVMMIAYPVFVVLLSFNKINVI